MLALRSKLAPQSFRESPGANEPAIAIEGVTVSYRQYTERSTSLKESALRLCSRRPVSSFSTLDALSSIDLTVARGEVLAIIGSNGSGKSTLLKVASGVLAPSRGRVEVRGLVTSLIELGAGFDPELTAVENIYLNGALFRRSATQMRERIEHILRFAELTEFAHTPLKYFSSGMFARLGFSAALDLDPDILIVDEILAVGDERFQEKCHGVFRSLIDRGKTILLVTHSMSQVESLADRAVLLAKGRIAFDGDPATAVELYRDEDYLRRLAVEPQARADHSSEQRSKALHIVPREGTHPTEITTEYPEAWKPYLHDWWQRTYFHRIVRFEGKYWFVKTVPGNPLAGARERLAYLLGRDWLNIAEVRLLEEKEYAAIRDADIELPPEASLENTYLVRLGFDYSKFALPIRSLDEAVAAELVFSLWIRRRDTHSFNRVYVRNVPVFFDHLTGLLGEPGLASLETFFYRGPDGGFAGWWSLEELGSKTLDVLDIRRREKEAFDTELDSRGVLHVVHNRERMKGLILRAADTVRTRATSSLKATALEAGFPEHQAVKVAEFLEEMTAQLDTGVEELLRILSR